ncbi:MAG TPA: zf-HC2 domain-containing protein [Pyrinomonadaceae bacterium]|nr:zf-HC2 domain-containing protein [Pyrinomonadaceae bacterium]
MAEGITHKSSCERLDASAYLDGELDNAASLYFEEHVRECSSCAATLAEQRRLLCLLDNAFGTLPQKKLPLPRNFAEVVTARAQSDMSGVRCRSEHRRAFLFCAALTFAAFALLGTANLGAVFAPIGGAAHVFGSILMIIARFFADALGSVAVILRAAGGHLPIDPPSLKLLVWTLLASAVILLLRLIGSYHRTRASE